MADPHGFSPSPDKCPRETKKEGFSEGFVVSFDTILRKRVTMEKGVILILHDTQAPGKRD